MGLLSIGEEESKGNELTREAYKLIKELPMNFVGNVEGRDLYNGKADVLVCDGFVGNVALKISEGMVETVRFLLKQSLQATISSQVGMLLSRKAFADFKKRLDYSEYGGAPLLGIKGVCIVSHGSSNANAIKNAIRVAMEFANSKLNHTIEERIAAASRNLNNHAAESAQLADRHGIGTADATFGSDFVVHRGAICTASAVPDIDAACQIPAIRRRKYESRKSSP